MNGVTRMIGRAGVVMLAAVALSAAPCVRGQQPDVPKGLRAAMRLEAQRLVVTVDFKGGTVAEYVAALKESCKPSPVNAVLSEGAATEKLAPISLRQASLAAAMQAIPAASQSGVNAWQIVRLMDSLPGDGPAGADDPDSAPVYQVYRAPLRKDSGPQRVVMEVFSLQRIVGREADAAAAEKKIAAVLTAAQTALRMDEQHGTAPDMKLHKESGLLIVRGEQEDVMAVKDVIERMSDDAGKNADETAQREIAARQAQINIAKAELGVKTARSQLDLSRAKLGQVEQLVAQGATSSTEALEMKAEVDRREGVLEMAILEAQSAQEAAKRGTLGVVMGGGRSGKGGGEGADVQVLIQQLRDENASLRTKVDDLTKHLQNMQAAMQAERANNPKGK